MADKPVILVNHLLEPPGRISGITRYLFALLAELVRDSNYRYALATTWSSRDLPASLRESPLAVTTLPFRQSMPANVLGQMATLPRLMRETGAVLEFNCNPIGCFKTNWPRVMTVHDLYFETMPGLYKLRHRLWWKLFFPLSLRAASVVMCVSRSTCRDLEKGHPGFGGKLAVVHEAGFVGADAADAQEGHLSTKSFEGPYALYVGNISPNKNPGTLIEALKILHRSGRMPIVYHVGSDPAGLLAEAQRRILPNSLVRQAGVLSDQGLVAAYRGATSLINTSLHEGFCLPVVEAQSLAVPVICSDIPVLREVAGEGALFFPPSDAEALAERIAALFDDAILQRRMAAASLSNAARFSWRRAAEETENVFDAVLANKRASRASEAIEKVAFVQ